MNENVSVKEWLGSMLLLCIPIVNLVLVFVWAFGNGTKISKSNFFKAYLLLMLISIVISIVLGIVFGASIFALMQQTQY